MEKNVLTREEAKAVTEELVPGIKLVCAMVEMEAEGNKRVFLDVLIEELEELARRTKTRITAGADVCRNNSPTENAAEPVTVDFGGAIKLLKAGKRLARKGWNGKGIYLELQKPDACSKMTLPYIYIVTNGLVTDNPDAPKGVVPWLASQTDMLAEDWYVVG